MKILVDAETKEILGASFLGVSGDEAIHCVLDTMYAKAPYTLLKRAMHIHPTVAEFIPATPVESVAETVIVYVPGTSYAWVGACGLVPATVVLAVPSPQLKTNVKPAAPSGG